MEKKFMNHTAATTTSKAKKPNRAKKAVCALATTKAKPSRTRVRKASAPTLPPKPALATDAEMLDFLDNVDKYKGKALKFEMSLLLDDPDESLREYAKCGAPVCFQAYPEGARLKMACMLSEDLDVPTAGLLDTLHVSFACCTGKLDSGNVAFRITRPCWE